MIEVKKLYKKFKDFEAVKGISFKVKPGEILAFLGPKGAGKTTTIKMLTTVLKPSSGEILINGFNPVKEKDKARNSFGIVFQDPSLDEELNSLENMYIHAVLYNIPKKERNKKIESLLKFVGLWDKRKEATKNFSGGMKRRLEIARGLLHHPRLLFLDEPTQGLDPQTRHNIWEHIKKMNETEKMTVFFSTHYIEEADKMADRVIIVDNGSIVAEGSPEELRKQTNSLSLEDAFIKLTGKDIREEKNNGSDRMRARMHR